MHSFLLLLALGGADAVKKRDRPWNMAAGVGHANAGQGGNQYQRANTSSVDWTQAPTIQTTIPTQESSSSMSSQVPLVTSPTSEYQLYSSSAWQLTSLAAQSTLAPSSDTWDSSRVQIDGGVLATSSAGWYPQSEPSDTASINEGPSTSSLDVRTTWSMTSAPDTGTVMPLSTSSSSDVSFPVLVWTLAEDSTSSVQPAATQGSDSASVIPVAGTQGTSSLFTGGSPLASPSSQIQISPDQGSESAATENDPSSYLSTVAGSTVDGTNNGAMASPTLTQATAGPVSTNSDATAVGPSSLTASSDIQLGGQIATESSSSLLQSKPEVSAVGQPTVISSSTGDATAFPNSADATVFSSTPASIPTATTESLGHSDGTATSILASSSDSTEVDSNSEATAVSSDDQATNIPQSTLGVVPTSSDTATDLSQSPLGVTASNPTPSSAESTPDLTPSEQGTAESTNIGEGTSSLNDEPTVLPSSSTDATVEPTSPLPGTVTPTTRPNNVVPPPSRATSRASVYTSLGVSGPNTKGFPRTSSAAVYTQYSVGNNDGSLTSVRTRKTRSSSAPVYTALTLQHSSYGPSNLPPERTSSVPAFTQYTHSHSPQPKYSQARVSQGYSSPEYQPSVSISTSSAPADSGVIISNSGQSSLRFGSVDASSVPAFTRGSGIASAAPSAPSAASASVSGSVPVAGSSIAGQDSAYQTSLKASPKSRTLTPQTTPAVIWTTPTEPSSVTAATAVTAGTDASRPTITHSSIYTAETPSSILTENSPGTQVSLTSPPGGQESTQGVGHTQISPASQSPDTTNWLPTGLLTASQASSTETPESDSQSYEPTKSTSSPDLPGVIAPPTAPSIGRSEKEVQIGFQYSLNYPFVVYHPVAAAQIFDYLPKGIANGLGIDTSKIQMDELVSYQDPNLDWLMTLAHLYIPSEQVTALAQQVQDRSSKLYQHPDASVRALCSLINTTVSVDSVYSQQSNQPSANTPQGSTGGHHGSGGDSQGGRGIVGAPGSLDQKSQPDTKTSRASGSTAGIAVGTVAGAGVLGGLLFLASMAIKKRNRSKPVALGDSPRAPSYHDEIEPAVSVSSILPSAGRHRAVSISQPMMTENSLGWQ